MSAKRGEGKQKAGSRKPYKVDQLTKVSRDLSEGGFTGEKKLPVKLDQLTKDSRDSAGVASAGDVVPGGGVIAPLAIETQSQQGLGLHGAQMSLRDLLPASPEAFQLGLARVVRARLVEVAGELGERGAASEFVSLVSTFRKLEGLEATEGAGKSAPLVNSPRSIQRARGRVVEVGGAEDFGGLE